MGRMKYQIMQYIIVKVENVCYMVHNGWFILFLMILCLFLDNSDSPSIVEQ